MREDVARRWTQRLRSGIPQGSNVLGTSDGKRCCLGVLCDMAVEEAVIGPPNENSSGKLVYAGGTSSLPVLVMIWAEVRESCGDFSQVIKTSTGIRGSLAEMNDAGCSFVEIADIIDAHWSEL